MPSNNPGTVVPVPAGFTSEPPPSTSPTVPFAPALEEREDVIQDIRVEAVVNVAIRLLENTYALHESEIGLNLARSFAMDEIRGFDSVGNWDGNYDPLLDDYPLEELGAKVVERLRTVMIDTSPEATANTLEQFSRIIESMQSEAIATGNVLLTADQDRPQVPSGRQNPMLIDYVDVIGQPPRMEELLRHNPRVEEPSGPYHLGSTECLSVVNKRTGEIRYIVGPTVFIPGSDDLILHPATEDDTTPTKEEEQYTPTDEDTDRFLETVAADNDYYSPDEGVML